MKRRNAIQSLLGAPAGAKTAAGILGIAAQATAAPAPSLGGPEFPLLDEVAPDAVGASVRHFFSAAQFAALDRASDLIFPSVNGMPGAVAAGASSLLDFLLTQSPPDRQKLFRDGAEKLNADAAARFKKPFADLSAEQAAPILAPLREPWTYNPPADPFANFLRELKADVFRAVGNSRQTADKQSAGRRRGGGLNTYWHGLD